MKLSAQWENLSEREKLIVSVGAIAFIIFILYFFVIGPFLTAADELQNRVQMHRFQLRWLQPASQRIQAFNSKGYKLPQPITGNLADAIRSSLQSQQLNNFLTELTPINDHQVKINFQSIPFDAAMDWLTSLWLNNGIQVKEAKIMPLKAQGLASVEIILSTN